MELIESYLDILNALPKTKAAKILKLLIELPASIPKTEKLQIDLC